MAAVEFLELVTGGLSGGMWEADKHKHPVCSH